MKDLKEMTVQELLDSGAVVDIGYHKIFEDTNKEQADEIVEGFGLTSVEQDSTFSDWVRGASEISDGQLSVSVFYEDDEHETEEAQAKLTEQERAMKEAGHKESDFR